MRYEVRVNGERYGVYVVREQADEIAEGLRRVWWAQANTRVEVREVGV